MALLTACQQMPAPQTAHAEPLSSETSHDPDTRPGVADLYGPPTKLGNLDDPAITESSGIVASRTNPGLYWTHNDSGDGPFIFAFDGRGTRRGVWRVTGASARDWEDVAAGPGPERGKHYLYIGDIGDNNENRTDVVVYRVVEPSIKSGDSQFTKQKPGATEVAEAIRLRYPDGKHNSETLLVHPGNGDIYIITKITFSNPTVYVANAPIRTDRITMLVRVGELSLPSVLGGMITGGDISPDGRRVVLCDYLRGYEMVLPDGNEPFDRIWKQKIRTVELGRRSQGEAVAYRLDGRALLTTSEGVHAPLSQVVRR